MRKLLLFLVATVALCGAVFGSAAALEVQGGALQSGGDSDLTCQDVLDDVKVEYKTAWVGSDKLVTDVMVNEFMSLCNNKSVQIELLNSGNTILGTATGTVTSGTTGWIPLNAASPATPKIADVIKSYVTVGDVSRP